MSIQAVAWVLEESKSMGSARLVMISLANHANKDGECWPAQRTIKTEAGLKSAGTIPPAIKRLEKLGEVEVVERGGPRKSARYRLPKFLAATKGERSGDERSDTDDDPEANAQEMSAARDTESAARDPERAQRATQVAQNHQEPSSTETPSSGDERPTTPEGSTDEERAPSKGELVQRLFDHWIATTGRTTRVLLSPDRRRRIEQALDRYPFEDVRDAISGIVKSAFHMGDNDRATRYDDLEHILGKPAKLEQFRDLHRGIGPAPRQRGRPNRNTAPPPCKGCGRPDDLCSCPGGPRK